MYPLNTVYIALLGIMFDLLLSTSYIKAIMIFT